METGDGVSVCEDVLGTMVVMAAQRGCTNAAELDTYNWLKWQRLYYVCFTTIKIYTFFKIIEVLEVTGRAPHQWCLRRAPGPAAASPVKW